MRSSFCLSPWPRAGPARPTERLLRDATDADCWVFRDPISTRFDDRNVLSRFKAYREGCLFREPGKPNPAADSWEVWEMGTIRPDWRLADIVKMVHPELRDGEWRYLALETWEEGHEAKRSETFKARGLDMGRAADVFADATLTVEGDRQDYGEVRYITIGFLDEAMVVLVWTRRAAARRIISMRKANERERRLYGPRF